MIGQRIEQACLAVPLLNRLYVNRCASVKLLEKRLRRRLGLPAPPSQVTLLVTYACNFVCDHCESTSHPGAEWGLPFETLARVIREIAEMGVQALLVSGGEPLVRPDIFDILAVANRERLQIHLFTNGSLVERHRARLAQAKLTSVFTSVDGLEETNDRFRRHQGAFKKTFRALELCAEMGICSRRINTLVHPGNFAEMEALGDWIMASAATEWRIALALPSGRAKGQERFCLGDDQIREVFEFIRDRRKRFPVTLSEEVGYVGPWALEVRSKPFAPLAGVSYCTIMPTGDVLGSMVLHDTAYSEGNIRHQRLQDLWRTGFQRYREPILPEACHGCRHFHACRGGTFGMRVGERHCLKRLWEGGSA